MTGFWSNSFFCVFYKNISHQNKKEQGQYPAVLTEEAWAIKDLLNGKRTILSCGT